MVGLILWPKSKRSVDLSTAKEIAAAIQEAGAKPVAIFVDEDAKKVLPRSHFLCLPRLCLARGDLVTVLQRVPA